MLVTCQKQVKIKLSRNLAGNVFSTVGEKFSVFKILLESTVIDTDRHITDAFETLKRFSCRHNRICDF